MPPTSRCPACCTASPAQRRAARPPRALDRQPRGSRCPACARHHRRRMRPTCVTARRQGRGGVRARPRPLPRPADGRGRRDQPGAAEAALRRDRDRCTSRCPRCSMWQEALAPGAPLVHEGWADYRRCRSCSARATSAIARDRRAATSSAGFAEADRIFEHRFTTRSVHQGYTEPRAAVAQWDGDGEVTVWSNTQLPFEMQSTLAEMLAAAALARCASSCRASAAASAASCASASSTSPRCWRASRARRQGDDDQRGGADAAYPRQPADRRAEDRGEPRRPARWRARAGSGSTCGAFAGSGPGVASVALQMLAGPYRIPNLLVRGLRRLHQQDELRLVPRAVGTAGELRRRIADGHHRRRSRHRSARVPAPQHRPRGRQGTDRRQVLAAVGLEECLRKAADAIGWANRRPGPGRGKGLACGWWDHAAARPAST